MQSDNYLLRAKDCINSLFFNGCRWSLLITAYALIAIIIVLSSETHFSEGLYAAEAAISNKVYDFGEYKKKDSECSDLSNDAYKENRAMINYGYTSNLLDNTFYFALDTYKDKLAFKTCEENKLIHKTNIYENVSAIDSVSNDKTIVEKNVVRTSAKKVEEAETKKTVTKRAATKKAETKKTVSKKEKKKVNTENQAVEAVNQGNMIKLSSEEKNILLRIVEAEATGEDIEGKMLVANVVLNRVKSGKFPDTVEQVVFQNNGRVYQFSPIRDGRYYDVRISKETKQAVEKVLKGHDKSQGALYFMSRGRADSSNVRWFDNKLTRLFKYGTHEFYK